MRSVAVIVLLSIAVAAAADKEKPRFAPGPAASYPIHQTLDQITLAAEPFLTDAEAATAFGKVNPTRYGVLPVLVIMENGTGKALRLNLRAEYITANNKHIVATPPEDVERVGLVAKAPRIGPGPSPIPLPSRTRKGPLGIFEIEGFAFVAKLLPIGERAFGFFYFQAEHEPGSRLYLTGVQDAATGKDYFYYELPLDKP